MRTGRGYPHRLQVWIAAGLLIGTGLACMSSTGNITGCLQGIVPGTTTRDQVIALLGEPASSQQEGKVENLLYPSMYSGQFNSISVQGGIVGRVSVVLGHDQTLKWSAVKSILGKPAQALFTDYSEGSLVYMYPDKGWTFTADESINLVYLRECFVPMSLADYLNSWGKDLPTENPFIR